MNWQRMSLGLLIGSLTLGLAACGNEQASAPVDLAADTSFSARGVAANGEQIFTANCSSCHSAGTEQLVGPGLAGAFSAEGPVLPAGVNYNGNLSNGQPRTETNVAAWIRNGGAGQIGAMSAQTLDDQQLADVIAYLRTLNK